jgi:hypothetical protein
MRYVPDVLLRVAARSGRAPDNDALSMNVDRPEYSVSELERIQEGAARRRCLRRRCFLASAPCGCSLPVTAESVAAAGGTIAPSAPTAAKNRAVADSSADALGGWWVSAHASGASTGALTTPSGAKPEPVACTANRSNVSDQLPRPRHEPVAQAVCMDPVAIPYKSALARPAALRTKNPHR